MSTFEIKENFMLNGNPFQIISGSFHYFRTVPEYWRDRLEKLKNLGCNTVETYIPWNFHETTENNFDFNGIKDIEKFIELTNELGLYLIIRPSPFICAEWEWGGLPAWLLKDPKMKVRTNYKPFLDAVEKYFRVLFPKLVGHQITNGGNIIMFQIENEYGYFGKDKKYLQFYADLMKELGVNVPLCTSDGPWGNCLSKGALKGALPTGNFGSKVKFQFGIMRSIIGKNLPLMVMEFWCGWFDHWGEYHHTSNLEKNKKDLQDALELGNINFYMFEGGTNFDFMSGRNATTPYGDITSYDYDAILTEDGRITPKYEEFKKIIYNHKPFEDIKLTTNIEYKNFGTLKPVKKINLLEVIDKISSAKNLTYPKGMEELEQNYGYILYRTKIKLPKKIFPSKVKISKAEDRINLILNGNQLYTALGKETKKTFKLPKEFAAENKENTLDILVENGGRINFSNALKFQRKGILGNVKINGLVHKGFEVYNLEFNKEQIENLQKLMEQVEFNTSTETIKNQLAEKTISLDEQNEWYPKNYKPKINSEKIQPAFYLFEFEADKCADTFLNMEHFTKGFAIVNGHNLGRYWNIGPQKKLYVPAPFIKEGKNTVIVFETE